MDIDNRNIVVYDLITELCENIYNSEFPREESLFPVEDHSKRFIKQLRSKAFEILLNKADKIQDNQDFRSTDYDPVTELFKYIFVLKLSSNRLSNAEALEKLLNSLVNSSPESQSIIYSTLQFLNKLKQVETPSNTNLDIFHYGKPNPDLPQISQIQENSVFQIYPLESFVVPDKFLAMLNSNNRRNTHSIYPNLFNEMSFSTRFISMTRIGIPQLSFRNENNTESTINQIRDITHFASLSTFSSQEKAEISYPITEDNSKESITGNYSNGSPSSFHSFSLENSQTFILENALKNFDINKNFKENRTWESLGASQPKKEMPFITEEPRALFHLINIQQTNHLIQSELKQLVHLAEIPAKQFLSDLKLLLSGIQSYSFQYVNMKNITIPGMTAKSLAGICQEAIDWGNSYKYLSTLVSPDPPTGKLQRKGPIFKAMCKGIKEFLLYYKAAMSIIFTNGNETGLLRLLNNVRPLALIITEVSRLCLRDEHGRCALGDGNGILTHIYKEVTQVTNPKVALIFYSILKSCCEVYFRFLQKWLFEGVYDNEYGEFMIQAQPQYLHARGHKFWMKSFTVNTKSVPDFLRGLTDSILNCGKTVRLLRICDPKNPVCNLFTTCQPDIRVCLSVVMLREQNLKCQEYEGKGLEALGKIVSLSSMIRDEKLVNKEKADLVVKAQQETLLKLQKKRAEFLKKEAENKRELLMQLKEQATQAALNREQEKEAELLLDKLMMERNLEQEKLEDMQRNADKIELLQYYEELAATEEREKMRSEWRIKRMNLFDKRVISISEKIIFQDSQDLEIIKLQDSSSLSLNDKIDKELNNVQQTNDKLEEIFPSTSIDTKIENCITAEDENSNISSGKKLEDFNSKSNDLLNSHTSDLEDPLCMNFIYKTNNERSALQDFLREEAAKISDKSNTINTKIDRPKTLRFAEAHYNKMKILQEEFEMTPNNNELTVPFTSTTNAVYTNYNNTTDTTVTVILNELNQNNDLPTDAETKSNKTESLLNTNILTDNLETSETNFTDNLSNKNNQITKLENLDTPMSCTTDIYALSTITPTSQLHSCEDSSIIDTSESLAAEKSYEESLQKQFVFPNLLGFSPNVTTPIASTSLTIADVETIDTISLQMYLEKSITIPLRTQSRLVNNAIIKYLLTEHKMLSHFHSLRDYYFLLNGEFAKSLTDSLYSKLYEFSMPIELFNSATLTSILKRSLTISFSSDCNNSKLLSLSATDLPTQLHISDPNALDCLCLNYKILWPLNIILDDVVMMKYAKVFKFLLMIGRVSWVLQEDFNIMKAERKKAVSEQYHKLQLYRHSMTQFINALHNYITCCVLYASWSEFEKDLENSLTVDEVYRSHVTYIKSILSRCMLSASGEKMRSCLNNIFKVILKFHNRLRSQSWIDGHCGHTHPNFKRLERIYEAFLELRTYLVHVALKLTTSGYQPHLVHFLDALNINSLYNLTNKKDR
ncbi:uncharacterized protein Grip163 isoform X2 [Prorops nasuta]|uniref:uncharacterized protein Grip163 isoform X2 n=1 Tax=Prorops nasuta TaxID=863751 RepID=UPI0034CEB481